MITYIKDYLLENQRVAVGGLGTLELTYREAEIHPICQDFTPPGKYLSFRADENEGGEDFSAYVAAKAGVEPEEARQSVARWVDGVNAALRTEGKFALGSMGCFVRGNVGPEFEPALDPELSSDSFGLNAFSLREERKELFERKEETVFQPEPEPEVPVREPETAKAEPVSETKEIAMEETKEEIREEAREETVEETKEEVREEESMPAMEESTAPQTENTDKPKKHVGRIIFYTLLILLLCAIIGVGVYAILRPDDFVQKKDYCISRVTSLFGPDTLSEDEPGIEAVEEDDEWYTDTEDGIQEEEVTAEEPAAEEPAPAAAPAMVTKAARCYIIVGGFGNPANADNLVRSLKPKYPNACNLGLNEKGTLTMVGVGPYTRAEAESKSQELSATYKDCWILEK